VRADGEGDPIQNIYDDGTGNGYSCNCYNNKVVLMRYLCTMHALLQIASTATTDCARHCLQRYARQRCFNLRIHIRNQNLADAHC
jgi:hypothetical protein